MGRKGQLIVALDIGTTKICVIIGEASESGIDIVGLGSHPSEGLRKGVVVNIDSTMESIRKAIEEAELMSGCRIKSVFTGISGGHVKSFNSYGIVAVRGSEVDEMDVKRAIEAAKAIAIPLDREVLHTLPQYYLVDDQDGVKDPIGMSGVRLEVKVHIITGAVTSIQNIIKSVNGVGLDINEIILESLAASDAVLSPDERDLGVALVDIGGGTTDVAVFSEGSIKHTAVLPLGGSYVTNDIAVGLRTPMAEAERVKIKFGCAYTPMIPQDEMIEVPSVGGREPRRISRQVLGGIIEPRMDEILNLVCREIVKSGYEERLAAGIVLTGGTALLEGVAELSERIFNMPVRRGIPLGVGGLTEVVKSPLYATGVGLLFHGSRIQSGGGSAYRKSEGNLFGGMIRKISRWSKELF
ncbi:MAG: cell division protein FtsA [Syntrophales bacterium]|nr:cell division protein FtsA [Syntrophales bacterium]MDD5231909.1 cell division protein FtsA [Syntrophales bacterium]MDD5531387.1 cell division protein FtsA [Syntrophales bacterium]